MTTSSASTHCALAAVSKRIATATGRRVFLVALGATIMLGAIPFQADGSEPIVRIEEDWEVVVGVPDSAEDSPQIITVLSPEGNLESDHAVFELNHSTRPSYSGGGMQLQGWVGNSTFDHRNFPNGNRLSTDNEAIRYTMSMKVDGGQLQFEVLNGSSTTWGSFGGQGYLKTSISSWRNDLSLYSPLTSTKQSRVGFASHRVKEFVRTEVRYYSANGLVSTDETDVVVHSYNPSDG